MISDRETLRRHLGGLPFISDTFRAKIVSSLVAAKRQSALGHAQHTEGSGYLTPDAGVRYLTEPHYRSLHERWRKCPGLMPAQIARIDRTRRAIIAREPTWESLLHIPVQFVVPDDPAVVNASNPLVPQTIALGYRAFESQDLLTTALIHEYAHVWMGLICEIADIDNGRDRRRFILPRELATRLCEQLSSLRTSLSRAAATSDSTPRTGSARHSPTAATPVNRWTSVPVRSG